jgi:GIY-YIG catalytic domain
MATVKSTLNTETVFGIYKVTNPIGEVYIGQSNNIERRWEEHKNTAGEADHKFYKSIKQYGAGYHRFEILENLNHVPVADHRALLNYLENQHYTLYKNRGVPLLNSNTPNKGCYTKKDRYTQLSISERGRLAVAEQERQVAEILEKASKDETAKRIDYLEKERAFYGKVAGFFFFTTLLLGFITLLHH